MSVAAVQPVPAPQPAPPRWGAAVLGLIAVLLAAGVPAASFAYSSNELDRAQALLGQGQYAQALGDYQAAEQVSGNAIARLVFSQIADRALAGAAETEFEWGRQEARGGNFAEAESRLEAASQSGVDGWQSRAEEALADLYLTWGGTLVEGKKFQDAIDKYRQVSGHNPSGSLKTRVGQLMATAYFGQAVAYRQAQPPDYADALIWFQDLGKEFPDSPEALQARAGLWPETLYEQALAFLPQMRYDQARGAMHMILSDFASSSWAAKATAALAAPQPLTGRLITADGKPVPNRLIRISTRWRVPAPHVYVDIGGQIYQTTTDGQGQFALLVPPGQNYLVSWWDPSLGNFVTTFINDTVPVNQINVDPLEPAHANVSTS